MRTLSIETIITIITFLILLSVVSFFALKICFNLISIRYKRIFFPIYWIYSTLIQLLIIVLFIYPYKASIAVNYNWYFIFNIALISDITIKTILSVSLIPYTLLKKRKKQGLHFLFSGTILSAGIFFVILYGALIGKNQIAVKRIVIQIENLPDSFDGFRIVQLSDIHLGSFNGNTKLLHRITQQVNCLNPDVIFFTGDLANNFAKEANNDWISILKEAFAEEGKYAILGNHDYGDYFHWNDKNEKDTNFANIISSYQKSGFRLLRNQAFPLIRSADTIYIAGVENWGHPPFPQYANLDSTLLQVPSTGFTILLSHDPSHWEHQVKGIKNIPLTLSGHTHGLQWGIKLAGISFCLMRLNKKEWGGLYEYDGQYLYVNRGIGTIGLNLRLDMPAEITEIVLKKK